MCPFALKYWHNCSLVSLEKPQRVMIGFQKDNINQPDQWSIEERKALVEYVALFTPVSQDQAFSWPATKKTEFWDKCADGHFMLNRKAEKIRYQVNSHLKKKYKTLEDAEKDLGVDHFSEGLQFDGSVASSPPPVSSPVFAHSPNTYLRNPQVDCRGDVIANIAKLLGSMSSKLREDFIQKLLLSHLQVEFGSEYKSFVPSDFVGLCCTALKILHENGKQNIIYHLARGLGTQRADGSGPRLPIDWMPFGLLSYNIQYFSSDTVNNLRADSDYINWETTMYSNFEHKWQVWEETFGNSAGLSLPENDVMEINPTSAMPNGNNIRQPNPVEILQTSPSADDDDNLSQISSSNVDNLDDSNTEELSFFVGTIKFGRARKCVIGRQTRGH
ncbi:Hypothetical predicted protein [Paramuricea clavata]|uniref:Uncharacterized protein n=1 Tax=Paramuricea clavata TaxID=317549 RepID=A0A6S7G1V8_PARCT|nr:Hypothetical predicted protein [Paramuricea clavata]